MAVRPEALGSSALGSSTLRFPRSTTCYSQSVLGLPTPGSGFFLPLLDDPTGRRGVSPVWVPSAEEQEGFPSLGERPTVGGQSLLPCLCLLSIPFPDGCFHCELGWTVSDLALSLPRCVPAGQLPELPAPGSQFRIGALKWDPPVPMVHCGLPSHSR